MANAGIEKIKQRQKDLDELSENYNIDPTYVGLGVLTILALRIATDQEWEETLEAIRQQRKHV